MSKLFAIAILAFCLLAAGESFAQAPADKGVALAAALDKTKHKKKEKKGFSFETYVEVKHVPAAKQAAAHSGIYTSEDGGYSLNLSVAADGQATGFGHDSFGDEDRTSFKLVNGRVSGAVLTGTKAYSTGKNESFEAVFVTRTVSQGKNANQIESSQVSTGLGFIKEGKDWTSRIFLNGVQ